MSTPTVLICARDDDVSSSIMEGILKNTSPILQGVESQTQGRQWKIVNKYYSADVNLYPLIDGQNSDHINFDTVEAVVIYVRTTFGESLATAEKRKQALQLEKSEVNILACDKCDSVLPRDVATAWCIRNNFQLVELEEEPEPLDESCPIKDYYGMDRIIHTLHANTWSNCQLQDECAVHNDIEDTVDILNEDEELEHMDQFCKLFSQMSSVTQNAASMPSDGRKAYAEQVVKAFWKAIGGDESELEDGNT